MAYAGFCQRESLTSLFQGPTGSEIRGYHPRKFCQISCIAIAVDKLPHRQHRKNCDASKIFGVSRKRFKTSMPGSNPALHACDPSHPQVKHKCEFLKLIDRCSTSNEAPFSFGRFHGGSQYDCQSVFFCVSDCSADHILYWFSFLHILCQYVTIKSPNTDVDIDGSDSRLKHSVRAC